MVGGAVSGRTITRPLGSLLRVRRGCLSDPPRGGGNPLREPLPSEGQRQSRGAVGGPPPARHRGGTPRCNLSVTRPRPGTTPAPSAGTTARTRLSTTRTQASALTRPAPAVAAGWRHDDSAPARPRQLRLPLGEREYQSRSHDDAEYARGVNDARNAQAAGPPGSAAREAAYREMEEWDS